MQLRLQLRWSLRLTASVRRTCTAVISGTVLTVFIRVLLLRGKALDLRQTTRVHFDHFIGVDRGVCSAS